MRVSEYYKLGRSQSTLDFVDISIDTDLPLFVNPAAIRGLQSPWGSDCISLLQHYFESVLDRINKGDKAGAVRLLSSLNERNEFHLGYSRGKSRGHGFGSKSGSWVWDALSESKAARSNLLRDLEDSCLLIHGIGPDMISDAVCNIIRGPLIKYTHQMCDFYGIPMEENVDSGPVWNVEKEQWEHSYVSLPIAKGGKLVFVPKLVVRFNVSYDVAEYYRHYLLPAMQEDEIKANTGLVRTLKDGRKKAPKNKLMDKYGADKLAVVEETLKRPNILEKYKLAKDGTPSKPLTHGDFAELERESPPNVQRFLSTVTSIPVGISNATRYENAIEKFLSVLFYPSLGSPKKQQNIHEGRKRIDITYVNYARSGFFEWVGRHYSSAHIFVECKNYGKEIGNPEIDQLAGRFSPSRGTVGILICRKIANKKLLRKRCRDTAQDKRGYIISLDDDDLKLILDEYMKARDAQEFKYLKNVFDDLIM